MNRSDNAIEILSKRLEEVLAVMNYVGYEIEDITIGFFDESSPQLSTNTARLWFFKKAETKENNHKTKEKSQ